MNGVLYWTKRDIMVTIIGPSDTFLSGISYYTARMSLELDARPVLFRSMLPKFLFPGKNRTVQSNLIYNKEPIKILDWYNPLTWLYACYLVRRDKTVILEYWTASVIHMYLFLACSLKLINRSIKVIIEVHEVIDPLENSILPVRIYARYMRRILFKLADVIIYHSEEELKCETK